MSTIEVEAPDVCVPRRLNLVSDVASQDLTKRPRARFGTQCIYITEITRPTIRNGRLQLREDAVRWLRVFWGRV